MMNNSLDRLHDIYIPIPLGFEWMLGHTLVSVFALSILISLLYFYVSYLLATRFKRTALKELVNLKANADLSGTFDLIKRVLLTTNKREDVARLSTENLVEFINADTNVLLANQSIYNKSIILSEKEAEDFYHSIFIWINTQEAIYD